MSARKDIVSFFLAAALCAGAARAETPRWTDDRAGALLHAAENADAWGLSPANEEIERLRAAIDAGDVVATELAASGLFTAIARELSDGATPQSMRRRWRIEKAPIDEAVIANAMENALIAGDIKERLDDFAPRHAEFQALSAAFAAAQDDERRETLRVNLERWRWMPANLGADYILVNVPSYEAIHVRAGNVISRRRVIVGAAKTPTPQFSAMITGVTVNPTWYVPASIIAESVGALLDNKPKEAARLGYYVAGDGGVRQKPGPANALGRMKLAMPNPYAVFVHDTPNRNLFSKDKRALSHGCVRIDDALGFAAELLGGGWDRGMIDEIVETGSTVTVDTPSPLPIYFGYFTAMTTAQGDVAIYPDIYRLDEKIFAKAASEDEAPADFTALCRETAEG